jgi:hypothetical protein
MHRSDKAMHENKIVVVKVGNEASSLFCNKSGVIHGCILLPFYIGHLDGLVSKERGKGLRKALV